MTPRSLLFVLACPGLVACGSQDDAPSIPQYPTDAGQDLEIPDTSYDSSHDASPDASPDTSLDTSTDLPIPFDAAPEALTDAGVDGSVGWEPFGFVTLNLHCLKLDGTSFSSNQERLQAVADTIHAQGVQVIAVQEACVAGGVDAIELLRAALSQTAGTPWSKHWVFAHKAWEGTADEADEGVGLLARGTLSDLQALEHWQQGPLRRVAASAVLEPSLGGFRVSSIHFDLQQEASRVSQARQAASHALAAFDPSVDVIIAGDFNDATGGTAYNALQPFGYKDLSASIPADMIDHVFTHRGSHAAALQASTIFDGVLGPIVSDHRGVLVRVQPAAGEPITVTRLRAGYDPGAGHVLTVRGNVQPLDWTTGWAGARVSSGLWKLVLTEIPQGAPVEYKWLVDDATWQTGGNASTSGGADQLSSPSF